MATPSKVESLYKLYDLMSFDQNQKQGSIDVRDQLTLEELTKALDDHQNTGFESYGEHPELNKEFLVNFEGQSREYGIFYYTFDQFLQKKDNLFSRPQFFYIADLKWHTYSTSEVPEIFTKYLRILEFLELITEASQYLDTDRKQWILTYEDTTVKLSANLERPVLNSIKLKTLDNFINFFEDNIHKKQKVSIFNKVIVNKLLYVNDYQETLSVVLNDLEDIFETIENDFAVFASNFSFDKIINQLENEKLEEQVKIHKVLTDIQAQILGIPIATVIVATQYKTDLTLSSTFWINLAILIGALIFTLLIDFTAHNQKNTLDAIQLEINRKKRILTKDFKKIAASKPYSGLEARIKYQRCVLTVIQIIVTLGFVIALGFFLKISEIF